MWNGTADTLKAKPTSSSTIERITMNVASGAAPVW
jgi:hypothetical protein